VRGASQLDSAARDRERPPHGNPKKNTTEIRVTSLITDLN